MHPGQVQRPVKVGKASKSSHLGSLSMSGNAEVDWTTSEEEDEDDDDDGSEDTDSEDEEIVLQPRKVK
jgi:hypothetical protein